jgi:hypothetical protein
MTQIFPILYSAQIVGHELIADHTGRNHVVYVIEIGLCDSMLKHRVYRRYSKFLLVDKLLESDYGVRRTMSRLPSLRRGTDDTVIEERKKVLSGLLDKFLAHLCPLVIDFFRIVPREDSRYDFSAVTSEVTSGVVTPVDDDSDEELVRRLEGAITSETPSFTIFSSFAKSFSFARDHAVSTNLLRLIIAQIGKMEQSPTDSIRFLRFLARLVSTEHNPSEAGLVRFLVNNQISPSDWAKGNLAIHVTSGATAFGNRADVFRLIFFLDKNEEELYEIFNDEQAVSLYLMWRDRYVMFADTSPGNVGETHVSAGAVSLMGPMSPLAASPAKSKNQHSFAHDAREWLMVSLAALDDTSIFPAQGVSLWRRVLVPEETARTVLGEICLEYRPVSCEFEIKFQWTFPAHINMELVLGLLYNPEELGLSLSGFFGITSACTVSCQEEDSLVKKICAYFDDPKKAVANLLITADRGVSNNTVVLAVVSDPSAPRPASSSHRVIRSLHMGGCEVNVTSGQMKGLFHFSNESIFLIAGDLLGERLVLWKAIEKFSNALKNPTIGNPDNHMSVWLRRKFSNS